MSTTRDRAQQALSKEFEKFQIAYGHATATHCHQYIHGDYGSNDEFSKAFNDLWVADDGRNIEAQNSQYLMLTRQGDIPPSVFNTHSNFYIELIAKVARRMFLRLIEIADEDGPIAWAASQVRQLVREHRPLVAAWLRAACDRTDTSEEWQAPALLSMQPAGPDPYEPDRAWERMDTTRTADALNHFGDEWLRRVEAHIENAVASAYFEFARLEAGKRRELMAVEGSRGEEGEPPDDNVRAQKSQKPQKEAIAKKAARRKMTLAEECPEERRLALLDAVERGALGLVRYDEAACMFQCSIGTIRNRVEDGKLDKVGSTRRLSLTSVRALLLEQQLLPLLKSIQNL